MKEKMRATIQQKMIWLWLIWAIVFSGIIWVLEGGNPRLRWLLIEVNIGILAALVLVYPIIVSTYQNMKNHVQELITANIELLEMIGAAIAKRDNETSLHNYRVATYAIHLAEAVGLPSRQVAELVKGVFLHDIGNILLKDELLLKPGQLTLDEFETIKTHTLIGSELVGQSSWLAKAGEIIRFHHEKYGGTGYMENLAGKYIPLNARIFAIVDVFDVLTSKRPYKEEYSFEKAMEILNEGSGTHFDPELLKIFEGIVKPLYNHLQNIDEVAARTQVHTMLKRYF